MKANVFILVAALFLASSCQKQPSQPPLEAANVPISQETLSSIKSLGFSSEGIIRVKGGYIVENDIFLSNDTLTHVSNHKKQKIIVGHTEQYSTFNLARNYQNINVSVDLGQSQNFYAAVDTAINRWNSLGLTLTFQRISSNGSINISFFNDQSGSGILARTDNFPDQAGNVNTTIRLNTGYFSSSDDPAIIGAVLQHEIGHAIGFRHTDYYDRSISCGGGKVNENQKTDGIGAVLIPGAPTKADQTANSFMLACQNGFDKTRSFNNDDKIAIQYIWGNQDSYPSPFYRFRNPSNGQHFLSDDYAEGSNSNLVDEGVQCHVYAAYAVSTSALFRFVGNTVRASPGDHIYSTSSSDIPGFVLEGIVAYVFSQPNQSTVPLYRFYNPNIGHFFTTDYSEGANAGLSYEGIACYVLP